MTRRTQRAVELLVELSDEERAAVFEAFIFEVENARTLVEMEQAAGAVEAERCKGPLSPPPEPVSGLYRLAQWWGSA